LLAFYALAFGIAAFGAGPPAFDDHPGQLYRLWHVVARGPAPWAWNPDWWAGYPEMQFYPPGFAYLGAIIQRASVNSLSVATVYQVIVWLTYLAPGLTTFAALARVLGSGWLALPGAFVALTLSAGIASGVEGGVHIGMLGARLAWALIPLLLLVLVPWIEENRRTPWVAALIVAAIVLTHPAALPAAATLVVLAAIVRRPRPRRLAGAVSILAFAAALTAFWAVPLTGMAPFSNEAPSTGELTVRTGVSIWTNGTVMTTRAGFSAGLPVSGSSAPMSNWLRPRRRSTSAVQRPWASAETRYGCDRPGVSIVIVAPGIEVPRSTYEVVSSETSRTAVEGVVTSSVGGFA